MLEHNLGLAQDAGAMAELSRIILLRIAELDAAEALEQVAIESSTTPYNPVP